jgi:enoyl-CoA hydratase
MSADSVLVEAGPVTVVTLNRPEKLNSWNAGMRARLREVIEGCARDPELRVLILTGAGRAFSAGEDVSEMAELTRMGTRAFRVEARTIQDVFDLVEGIEVPVIAAFDGVAAGGGLELALSCDFRVIGEKARLVMPEARVGLIPGSGGCSRLVRHIGLGRAKELVMLGATVPAARALDLGLATEVVADGNALNAAKALAERLLAMAPLALGMAKLVLNTCTDVDSETGRRLERLAQSVLKATDDHREGVAAFGEKRPPKWAGQ